MNEELKNAAKAQSMLALFNATANAQYLRYTYKEFDELKEYLSFEKSSWSKGLHGNEWYTVNECIIAATKAANVVIYNEILNSRKIELIINEVYNIFPVINGYKQCPTGNYLPVNWFHHKCFFGDNCTFNNLARFGFGSFFGENCNCGSKCNFEQNCNFCKGKFIEKNSSIISPQDIIFDNYYK